MYCLIFIYFSINVIGALEDIHESATPECANASKNWMSCCVEKPAPALAYGIDKEEGCDHLSRSVSDCSLSICKATIRGIGTEDGNIIKNKMIDFTKKDFENYPDLLEILINKCINGDLSPYGESDTCPLTKLNICYHIQGVKFCNSWKDNGVCKGIAEQVAGCMKRYD